MNWDQGSRWLTVLSNFGVIGGLVLVAMQMNLNSDAIKQQNEIELYRGLAAGELAFMGDSTATAFAVALFRPAKLDEVQIGQVWAYMQSHLLSVQQNWLSHKAGMASDATWARARAYGANQIAFDAGRIWWREAKITFDPDFVAEIEAELATIDPSIDLALMNRKMLEEIHQIEKDAAESSEPKELSPPIEQRSSPP